MAKWNVKLTIDPKVGMGILNLRRKLYPSKVSISAIVNRLLTVYLEEEGVSGNKERE